MRGLARFGPVFLFTVVRKDCSQFMEEAEGGDWEYAMFDQLASNWLVPSAWKPMQARGRNAERRKIKRLAAILS